MCADCFQNYIMDIQKKKIKIINSTVHTHTLCFRFGYSLKARVCVYNVLYTHTRFCPDVISTYKLFTFISIFSNFVRKKEEIQQTRRDFTTIILIFSRSLYKLYFLYTLHNTYMFIIVLYRMFFFEKHLPYGFLLYGERSH